MAGKKLTDSSVVDLGALASGDLFPVARAGNVNATKTTIDKIKDYIKSVFDGIYSALGHNHAGEDIYPDSVTTDYVQLTGGIGTEGRISYNSADGTIDVIQGGGNVTQQVGQETYIRVKASADISEGQVVMSTGTVGNSGRMTAAPAAMPFEPQYIIGVATENILEGDEGLVTNFGLVRKIDTSGWAEGSVLYVDTTGIGALTDVEPEAPNYNIIVAMVIVSHAANGSIFVRVYNGLRLRDLHDVDTELAVANDIMYYNGSYWARTDSPMLKGLKITEREGLIIKGATSDDYYTIYIDADGNIGTNKL